MSVHLTGAPPACSGCGGQYPDRRHVDFEAAWDGPVINAREVVESHADAVQIDDVVLCETCIKEAVQALALDASSERLLAAEARVLELEAVQRAQAKVIEKLDAAAHARAELSRARPARKKTTA